MFLKTNGNIIPIGININILPISISRIQVPIESSLLIKYLYNDGTKLKLPENQPKLSPVEYPFLHKTKNATKDCLERVQDLLIQLNNIQK